ncbi:MAG: hypothetical protein K9M97_06615 [Akkermansiaceae bacterium]|nr:hypothetical protein [Akkermansiaceae bacterium]
MTPPGYCSGRLRCAVFTPFHPSFSPPSGPATGSGNGLHSKSNFLGSRRADAACCGNGSLAYGQPSSTAPRAGCRADSRHPGVRVTGVIRIEQLLLGVNMRLFAFVLGLMLALQNGSRAADALPGAPTGVLLAGSACAATDELVDDAEALGGKAATASGAYQPLVRVKPPVEGEAFTVWVHRKSGPIQLKTLVNGDQQEKGWNWDQPGSYEWCNMGRFNRPDLGDGIVVIRADGQDKPRIDCVVLSSDAAAHPKGMKADGSKELPPEAPDASLAPTITTVTIDWSKTAGKMTAAIWGVNDCEVKNSGSITPGFEAFLASLKPTLVRIHDAGLANDWTDPKTRTWRTEQIKAGFDASTGYGSARIILNIPAWPDWLPAQADGTLTPAGEDEFVKLVGRLVVVMREQVKHPVAYWELLNEKEDQFEKIGKAQWLWNLHNRLFAEIKKQDPSAKVGGPAFTWPKPVWVEGFLKGCGQNVDFVTWHNYASGDIFDSNESVFARADALTDQARYIKEAVDQATAGRKVECFLDEYNIKWAWEPMERRHGNNVGAVFQACVLKRMALLGLDGVTVWHAKGGAYGLVDNDDTIRRTGRLYQLGSRCLVGTMAEAKAEEEKDLELIAVKRDDGVRSVLLINRADHTVIVRGAGKLGLNAEAPTLVRIAADGVSLLRAQQELAGDGLRLPGYSVSLLTGDASVVALVK